MTQVLVRADASTTIGQGHVMRCLALARAWRERGATVRFACREQAGDACARIEKEGFALWTLPPGEGCETGPLAPPHAHWLGAHWQEDAEAIRALLAKALRPDWLVVDHYALDRRWEDALRGEAGAVMVIDDLADREHGPCVLLDQGIAREGHARYAGRIAEPSRWLLGPRYALLRPEFARLHERAERLRDRVPRRLLLHFGGGPDPHDIAGRALVAAAATGLEVDLVAGRRADALRASVPASSRLRIHAEHDDLTSLVEAADLAMGAAGVSALERICAGLPSIVVSMAENQRAGAQEMARLGLVRHVGHHDTMQDLDLAESLARALAGLPDPQWTRRCLDAVDGHGVGRVLAALEQAPAPRLVARVAGVEDERLLFDWANDPTTRSNAFSSQPIPLADHRRWLRARLADADCRLLIVEAEGEGPIGTIRLQKESRGWEVHFNLAPPARGRGLGRALVAAGLDRLAAEVEATTPIFGRVKADNRASRRIFEALGFVVADPGSEVLEYGRRLAGLET